MLSISWICGVSSQELIGPEISIVKELAPFKPEAEICKMLWDARYYSMPPKGELNTANNPSISLVLMG